MRPASFWNGPSIRSGPFSQFNYFFSFLIRSKFFDDTYISWSIQTKKLPTRRFIICCKNSFIEHAKFSGKHNTKNYKFLLWKIFIRIWQFLFLIFGQTHNAGEIRYVTSLTSISTSDQGVK